MIDFIRFIEVVKSQYKQDLHYSSYKEKLLHKFAGMSCKTLLFQYIPYFMTHLHLACLKQYPKANHPEDNERSANLQHCQQPGYSFSGIPLILWVVSTEMNEK